MNKEDFIKRGESAVNEIFDKLGNSPFLMSDEFDKEFKSCRDEFNKLKDSEDWYPGLVYINNRLARIYNSL